MLGENGLGGRGIAQSSISKRVRAVQAAEMVRCEDSDIPYARSSELLERPSKRWEREEGGEREIDFATLTAPLHRSHVWRTDELSARSKQGSRHAHFMACLSQLERSISEIASPPAVSRGQAEEAKVRAVREMQRSVGRRGRDVSSEEKGRQQKSGVPSAKSVMTAMAMVSREREKKRERKREAEAEEEGEEAGEGEGEEGGFGTSLKMEPRPLISSSGVLVRERWGVMRPGGEAARRGRAVPRPLLGAKPGDTIGGALFDRGPDVVSPDFGKPRERFHQGE